MPTDTAVPQWCDFFDEDEYARFCEALDDACSCWGAEGRDFDDGTLCLYAGARPDECYFSLDGIAARCRDSPPEEWESICFSMLDDWIDGIPQHEWLMRTPFAEVEPLLEVWLAGKRPVNYEGGQPGDPGEPFAVALAEGLHVCLAAEMDELGDSSEMMVLVRNSAVEAWGKSTDDLLDWARRRLRHLPLPAWRRHTVEFDNEQGVGVEVDLYLGAAPDGVATPASAWALLLGEVAPEPSPRGALVAFPERNTLVFAPRREQERDMEVAWALYSVSGRVHDETLYEERVTPVKFAYDVTHGTFQAALPEWNAPPD